MFMKAEDYLKKHTFTVGDETYGNDEVVLIEEAQEAVRLARKEGIGEPLSKEQIENLIHAVNVYKIKETEKTVRLKTAKEIFSYFDAHFCGSDIGAKDELEKHKLSLYDGDYDLIKKKFLSHKPQGDK